jgi:hypothetical protein
MNYKWNLGTWPTLRDKDRISLGDSIQEAFLSEHTARMVRSLLGEFGIDDKDLVYQITRGYLKGNP